VASATWPQVELHARLVGVVDVVFVELGLVLDEAGVEAPVRHVGHHRVGNVADAAQAGRLQRQFGRRNIDPHATHHDWHQFLFAKLQAEIIYSFHCHPD
jgi:hypothetical protein